MTILDTIVERTRERIREEKQRCPLAEIRAWAEAAAGSGGKDMPAFERALRREGLSFICEVKKASPSKGLIASEFPYVEIAEDYEAAGASAISCLTEPYWFKGSDRYLEEIARRVSIPVLRKDFTCDEYMIYQAKAMGASAVLLICSVLDDGKLRAYRQLAAELGLSALVEAHTAEEIERAQKAGAVIIGVNNRNLKDFTVDIGRSVELRRLVDKDRVFVSESGIRGPEDMKALYENGTDAVLGAVRERDRRCADRRDADARGRPQGGASVSEGSRGGRRKHTMVKIKICGLSRTEDIAAVNEARPDYCGFVIQVPSSRRNVTEEQLRTLKAQLSDRIRAVGVFVNADPALPETLLRDGVIDIAQLHGERTGKPVIKAFSVAAGEDLERAFSSCADMVLLDHGQGGTGEAFDWTVLERYRAGGEEPEKPFFLAGGLSPDNISEAVRRCMPFGVDLSSAVETDGKKDREKIMAAVAAVRSIVI